LVVIGDLWGFENIFRGDVAATEAEALAQRLIVAAALPPTPVAVEIWERWR
jgi:hypothetical protein